MCVLTLLIGVKSGRPGRDAPGDCWLITVWVAMIGVFLLTGRVTCIRPFVSTCPRVSAYGEQPWRRAVMVGLRLIALVAFLMVVAGVGWWVWDSMIDNPMPYRDPEPPELSPAPPRLVRSGVVVLR